MPIATPFKALGAGNGFPGCLGDPTGGEDYDSSSLNDVSLEVAMKHCWNIKSVTFGPLTFDLTQNIPSYWTYPNYEPKALVSDTNLPRRYAYDDGSISSEVFEISMGIGSALTVEGVRKYFHGIHLVHNHFSDDGEYAEIQTTYASRPNFTAAQVAAKNVIGEAARTDVLLQDGEFSEPDHVADEYNEKTFTQSVVTIGGLPFLKTVAKFAEHQTSSVGDAPVFNYPPDTAPTTASFTFFDY